MVLPVIEYSAILKGACFLVNKKIRQTVAKPEVYLAHVSRTQVGSSGLVPSETPALPFFCSAPQVDWLHLHVCSMWSNLIVAAPLGPGSSGRNVACIRKAEAFSEDTRRILKLSSGEVVQNR